MAFQKLGFALLLAIMAPAAGSASVESGAAETRSNLAKREQQFVNLAVHATNFSATSRMAARISCEAAQPPEALATPDPLVATPAATTKITVSFIIGTDGRVHSPLILESLGPSGDRIVLDAVRAWRYRPATCNGVPTEVEGKIAFSSR